MCGESLIFYISFTASLLSRFSKWVSWALWCLNLSCYSLAWDSVLITYVGCLWGLMIIRCDRRFGPLGCAFSISLELFTFARILMCSDFGCGLWMSKSVTYVFWSSVSCRWTLPYGRNLLQLVHFIIKQVLIQTDLVWLSCSHWKSGRKNPRFLAPLCIYILGGRPRHVRLALNNVLTELSVRSLLGVRHSA